MEKRKKVKALIEKECEGLYNEEFSVEFEEDRIVVHLYFGDLKLGGWTSAVFKASPDTVLDYFDIIMIERIVTLMKDGKFDFCYL